MTDRYILDAEGNPQPEPDMTAWAQWFKKADRHLGFTEIGEAKISTVFLGVDQRLIFGYDSAPILFESMIFWEGHEFDQEQIRYETRAQALAGHEALVARVRSALN